MDEVDQSEMDQVAPVEAAPIDGIEEQQEQPVDNTFQDKNWRELNRAKRELEKKAKIQDELIERLIQHQRPPQNIPDPVDELDSISDDDHLVKGQSRKLVRKEVEPLQKRIDELEARLHRQSQESQFDKLKAKYSDFDDIVNPETLAIFEDQEPELAQAIVETKDPYKKWIQTYKYIKACNISEQVPKARRAKEIDKKIESNKKTVQSPQAFDKRPMAQAFQMSQEQKSKLYEEMMHCARQASSSL